MIAPEPGRIPKQPDPEGLADALAHATFMTMAVLTKLAADNDLSLTQLRLLAILRDRRVTMTALATHLGLDKSSMTGLVDRAQRRGLLIRTANASDGRAIDVMLSPAGIELAAGLQARTAQSLSALTDRLTPADQRRLQTHLERMVRAEQA